MTFLAQQGQIESAEAAAARQQALDVLLELVSGWCRTLALEQGLSNTQEPCFQIYGSCLMGVQTPDSDTDT